MMEMQLLNYGVLGLWTVSMIVERYNWQKGVTNAIKDLTKAIEKKI